MSKPLRKAVVFLAAVSPVLLASPGTGLDLPHASAVAPKDRAVAPLGAIMYCQRYPSDCGVKLASVATVGGRVILSDRLARVVERINGEVNRQITRSIEAGGNADIWRRDVAAGDCEDFALTKRAALLREGFPSSAVLIATAISPAGQAHAVLIVRTDRGDYILDNLTDRIRGWPATSYHWLKIQSPESPSIWLKL